MSDLAASKSKPLNGFGLFGVVKETGVDDDGLTEFATKYFPHPLYRDEDKALYEALGNRKSKLTTWNPLRIWRGMKEMGARLKIKGIEGNMKGEGLVQGGVVIFGKDGEAKYSFKEETGSELPEADILAAIDAVRNQK